MRRGRRPCVVVSSGQSSTLSAFALEKSGGGGLYPAQQVSPDRPLTGVLVRNPPIAVGGFRAFQAWFVPVLLHICVRSPYARDLGKGRVLARPAGSAGPSMMRRRRPGRVLLIW